MANTNPYEGAIILEDFVCDAIPAPGVPAGIKGRGVNAGWSPGQDPEPPSASRVAELEAMHDEQLLALVRSSTLSREELVTVHEIATRRLTEGHNGPALELSRAAMQAAMGKPA
jgi:hypothetical protein